MTDMFGHASSPLILRDYQLHGIELLRTAIRKGSRRPLLVAPTGCHAAGTKILMADGRLCAVEHICVGDAVMGPDSKRRTVTALHRGIDDMYRVVPVKGEPFVVNGDHVLALRVTNDGSKRAGKVDTVTVREWLSSNTTYKHTRKLFRVGVEFPYRSLPVHPYMLGVILGDGCIRAGAIVANPDEEIRVAMAPLAKAAGLEMHEFDRGDRCPTFSLVTDIGKPNHLIRHLKSMGLMGCDSYGKFVPWDYKICSTEQRLELLAGLMDTDGSLANGIYDFVSASRRLADDVVFLARSVGLAAYMAECTKKWQGGVGQYWRVCISGDVSRIPCRVERKQAAPRKQIKNPLVTGFHVEPIGVGTYYGFECSGDHLYVMGDFTVTHNSGKTTWAADIIRSAVSKGGKALFLAPRRELVYQASARLRSAGIPHGVLMAQAEHLENFDAPVQVGSIDTLIARLFRQRSKIELPAFTLILVDEAHLAITQRRNDLLAHWPNAMVIGLTATPVRKDGRALGLMFDELVQPTSVRELIDAGYLVKPRYFSLSQPDLARVRITAGDYNAADLEEAVNKSELVGDIVQHWMEHAGDRRTVVFCTSIKHSVAVCEAFLRQGVAAEHVDANTPNDEREAIFKRFTSGDTQLLTNCLAGETEVLTQQGVRPIRELAGGSHTILTRRNKVGISAAWVSAEFRSFGVQPLMRITFQRGKARKEVYATPGHGWLIETGARVERIETVHLVKGMRPQTARAHSYLNTGINPSPVGIQHGIWYGDGSSTPADRNVNSMRLCGPAKAELVAHFSGYVIDRPEWASGDVVVRGGPNFFKALPSMTETAGYLLGWLMGYFATDGCVSDGGRMILSSADEQSIQRARDVASVLGIGTWTIRKQIRKTEYIEQPEPMWFIGLRQETVDESFFLNPLHLERYRAYEARMSAGVATGGCGEWKVEKVEATDRVEEVFCATVPDTHNFTLTDEIVTGNCFLASYGFDLPELSCVVLARPTKSLMLYLQMLGRGLRPAPGKGDCLVLDHAGCVHLHGFAEQDREWSLDGAYSYDDDKQSGESERNTREVKPIECPECHAVFSKTPVCPECGYRLKTIGQAIETLDGKLVEIGTGYEVKPKPAGSLKFYLELRGYAQERGYKPGWAGVNYKKLYNDWPPRAWEREEALPPSAATVRWVKSQIAEWRKSQPQENRSTAA